MKSSSVSKPVVSLGRPLSDITVSWKHNGRNIFDPMPNTTPQSGKSKKEEIIKNVVQRREDMGMDTGVFAEVMHKNMPIDSGKEWEKKARKALREKMLYFPAKPILDDQIDGLRPIIEELIAKSHYQGGVEAIEMMHKIDRVVVDGLSKDYYLRMWREKHE